MRNYNIINQIDKSEEFARHNSLRVKIKKIEDSIFINNYIRFPGGFVDFGGWPISADLGVTLINDIEKYPYSAVLEFGSGLSTVIFNKIFSERRVPVLSIEHDETYFDKSKSMLTECSLSSDGLILSGLVNIKIDKIEYIFYDCLNQLTRWERSMPNGKVRRKLLLLIDGPPAKTCHLARYPSLIYVSKVFVGWDIHVYLDDFNRNEEKETACKWKDKFGSAVESWCESDQHEKGLLTFMLRN